MKNDCSHMNRGGIHLETPQIHQIHTALAARTRGSSSSFATPTSTLRLCSKGMSSTRREGRENTQRPMNQNVNQPQLKSCGEVRSKQLRRIRGEISDDAHLLTKQRMDRKYPLWEDLRFDHPRIQITIRVLGVQLESWLAVGGSSLRRVEAPSTYRSGVPETTALLLRHNACRRVSVVVHRELMPGEGFQEREVGGTRISPIGGAVPSGRKTFTRASILRVVPTVGEALCELLLGLRRLLRWTMT